MQQLPTPASAVNSIRDDTLGERNLVLSALGVAATRSRLQTNIFESIGVALRLKQIDCAGALAWLEEEGLLDWLRFGPEDQAMNAPRLCNACGCTPCDSSGFCWLCREVDREDAKKWRGRPILDHELPSNGHSLSVGALWDALNHPDRYPPPRSIIEAIIDSVKAHGANALKEPANLDRLDRCDDSAKAEINARLTLLGARDA